MMAKQEYMPHCEANMLVGWVRKVWGLPGEKIVLLGDCASSPGEGCGYELDPDDIYIIRLDEETDVPEVGYLVDVKPTFRLSETVYDGGWWQKSNGY
jgi:hypothetical protein